MSQSPHSHVALKVPKHGRQSDRKAMPCPVVGAGGQEGCTQDRVRAGAGRCSGHVRGKARAQADTSVPSELQLLALGLQWIWHLLEVSGDHM